MKLSKIQILINIVRFLDPYLFIQQHVRNKNEKPLKMYKNISIDKEYIKKYSILLALIKMYESLTCNEFAMTKIY